MIDSFYPYTSEFKLETIQTVHSQDLGLCAHDGRNSFATWLMQKENDRILQALAIDRKMAYDLARPAFGVLLPFEDGWCITDENEPQKVDMLVTCIDSVLERDSIDLAIARKVPKNDAWENAGEH